MRPIASLLMRCGMTWKEFAELCKSVFVEVASEEYGIRGRKTNVSRTAILTGISRKEVKRQRDLLEAERPITSGKTTDATRVLSGWHQDARFTDSQGNPLELPLEGGNPSFNELIDRYGGDIPRGAMLKELKAAKAVIETEPGTLRAIRRHYMPVQFDPERLSVAGFVLGDIGDTVNYNLTRDEQMPSRFLGSAINEHIDPKALPAFREFMEGEGEQFLERLDDWLSKHELASDATADKQRVRLSVGVYASEDINSQRGQS